MTERGGDRNGVFSSTATADNAISGRGLDCVQMIEREREEKSPSG
jgi:hypothetical protein